MPGTSLESAQQRASRGGRRTDPREASRAAATRPIDIHIRKAHAGLDRVAVRMERVGAALAEEKAASRTTDGACPITWLPRLSPRWRCWWWWLLLLRSCCFPCRKTPMHTSTHTHDGTGWTSPRPGRHGVGPNSSSSVSGSGGGHDCNKERKSGRGCQEDVCIHFMGLCTRLLCRN